MRLRSDGSAGIPSGAFAEIFIGTFIGILDWFPVRERGGNFVGVHVHTLIGGFIPIGDLTAVCIGRTGGRRCGIGLYQLVRPVSAGKENPQSCRTFPVTLESVLKLKDCV